MNPLKNLRLNARSYEMPQRNVRRFLRSMKMKMRKKRNRARRKMRIRLRSKTN